MPPQVPTGDPLEVVRAAPDLTTRAGRVRVFVAAPLQSLEAELDLSSPDGPEEVREQAVAALDLVRTVDEARPYGGQQVRGAPTMRYEVTVEGGGEFNVWVDVEGRVRRVLRPDGPLTDSPPPKHPTGLPALITIDFVFDEPEVKIAPGGPDL